MVQEKESISVLTVTYNNQQTIEACIDAVYNQDGLRPKEFILIDNASSDGTLEVAEKFPAIKIIRNPTNLGFCAANNLGIAQATGEYILLLNPDARLTENFLAIAIQTIQNNPRVALLAGKVLYMDTNGQPVLQDSRPVIDSVGIAMHRNRKAVDIGQGETDQGQYDQESEVWGVSGAACLCRRSALLEVLIDDQIFDETFFAYKEDVDLSWRLRLFGWQCWYSPRALAYHARGWRKGGDRQAIPSIARYHSYKNRRIMIMKNETWHSLLPDLAPILWFELQALAYALLKEPFLLKAYPEIGKIPEGKSPRLAIP
jgi:GT2 family glycosyltransferase